MKFNELKKNRREGFTLVEMVVVVTILGVLSGLGFTKFEGVQAKAKENADYIAASNLATAANLYLNDNPSTSSITTEDLKSRGYITSVPQPQSISSKSGFTIKILGGSVESVDAGNKTFYPKVDSKTEIDKDDQNQGS